MRNTEYTHLFTRKLHGEAVPIFSSRHIRRDQLRLQSTHVTCHQPRGNTRLLPDRRELQPSRWEHNQVFVVDIMHSDTRYKDCSGILDCTRRMLLIQFGLVVAECAASYSRCGIQMVAARDAVCKNIIIYAYNATGEWQENKYIIDDNTLKALK